MRVSCWACMVPVPEHVFRGPVAADMMFKHSGESRADAMDPQELYAVLRRQPFEPFCLHVSDGKHYEIRHPEQMILSRRAAHVGIGPDGEGPFQRIAIVSLVHVTRVEPIPGRRRAGR